ncbi:MAG: VOC family protein [Marinibacterium sp.]|nr:VOC family protein [Marinibacterium sp.]
MQFVPEHAVVWAEIPVGDLDGAMAYYAALGFDDFTMNHDGPTPIAIFRNRDHMTGVAGHLYPGKPAAPGTGPTVHLAAPAALDVMAERVAQAGGTVVSPPIEIPAGQFIYTQDPDGNSVSFFRES